MARSRAASAAGYKLIPNFASAQAVMKYSTTVSAQLAPSESQNPKPARSIAGITRKMGSEGSTYQKVASA